MINIFRSTVQYLKSNLSVSVRARWYRIQARLSRAQCRARVGAGSYVDPSVHVLRWRSVSIGENTCIAFGTNINVNDYKSLGPTVIIGDNCWIGLRNFFSPGSLISVGNYCMTGPDCKFIGTGHVFSDPYSPYISTGTEFGKGIRLGANCLLGAGVMIMSGVSVGHGSVIGASALLLDDVPPFSLVVGNPARVVKRFDVNKENWVSARDYSLEQEMQLPTEEAYLARLRNTHPRVVMPWRAAGKNMGDTY